MNNQSQINELEDRAASFREKGLWSEACECYEKILQFELSHLNKAKILGNLMQMYEKVEKLEEAIDVGTKALEIVEAYSLHNSMEGARLRGFVKGCLSRLRGEPFKWNTPISLLSAYFIGASLGAAIGSRITFEGMTIKGVVLTDFRYGGAGIGAVIISMILSPILARFGIGVSLFAGLFSFIGLCIILFEKNTSTGIAVLFVLLLPILFFARRSIQKG